ncbi:MULTISPECIES: leucyl aminopeptidase family protein [Brevibacillus]|uniref:leucyl aminopeptidase family protein n=1 Tax=Brevibacillus TaxID=55080 RepID=UPI001D0B9F43|nr:leucyl aminopeptidase family protein [Brevibacillus borstelensis]MCC0565190.1 leucyl aminopeptidase family protein [Brevibacillus borstelensis]MCM3590027.1 leucyl aminopeptidase family protein [Brevibacillus borstelensis]MED2009247.1 leucyl aminopeptidase family protein [Brevibacillus borstelensis]
MDISVGQQREMEVTIRLLFQDSPTEHLPYALRPHMKAKGAVTWFFGRGEEGHELIIGLGERARFDLEALRDAAGNAGRAAEKERVTEACVTFDSLEPLFAAGLDRHSAVTAWTEGWLLGTYVFDRYLSKAQERSVSMLHIACPGAEKAEQAIEWARIRAKGTCFARDLVNEPPNQLTPVSFVERLQNHFAARDVDVTVHRGEALERLQMVGLITVGKGSVHPPAMVEIRYCTDPSLPLTALIGKGVTFDMGGMNVKAGRDISDARMDMGGAAAVAGALDILTSVKARANLLVLLPIAENVPDGGAFLPSDVIRYPNGLSVQTANTDAEGRLILADALIHADRLGAKQAIDIATLTGNVGEALGLKLAGIWGDSGMTAKLIASGNDCGDRLWRMPLVDDYEELLKSDYADMTNISPISYGGAIVAALFIRRFVAAGMKWVHIDMAPPVQAKATGGYRVMGATGYGARLLADYVLAQ